MNNRRSFLIRAGLLASGLGAALWLRENVLWPEPRVAFPEGTDSSGWLPYARRNANVPTVAATVAGRPVTALIDSGAQYSVIDRRLFAELGLTDAFPMPLVAYGVGGGAQVGRGVTLDATVGALNITGLRTAILDLGPLADPDGLATPLILGQDVLGELVLELDAPDRRVRLVRPAAYVPWPDAVAAKVSRQGTALTAEVTIEGATATAVVDTGASSLLALNRSTAEAAGLLDGRPARTGSSLVLGGMVGAQVIKARTVTFADALFRDVDVAVFPDVNAPGFPDALIGMEALRGRRAALNLGAGALHLARAMDLTVGPRRQGRV